MPLQIQSIRAFIGAKEFDTSRSFYSDLGFDEKVIGPDLSLFFKNDWGFYLQRYYVKEWVDNSVLFVVVPDVNKSFAYFNQLELHNKYPGTKLLPITQRDWGSECFIIDPAGVLFHFAQFV